MAWSTRWTTFKRVMGFVSEVRSSHLVLSLQGDTIFSSTTRKRWYSGVWVTSELEIIILCRLCIENHSRSTEHSRSASEWVRMRGDMLGGRAALRTIATWRERYVYLSRLRVDWVYRLLKTWILIAFHLFEGASLATQPTLERNRGGWRLPEVGRARLNRLQWHWGQRPANRSYLAYHHRFVLAP